MNQQESDEFAVNAWIKQWEALINDLEKIKSSECGDKASLTLALCYIEALGRILEYKENKSKPPAGELFQTVLSKYNVNTEDAKLIWRHMRCNLVHTGPMEISTKIHGKQYDLRFFVPILLRIIEDIRSIDDLTINKIVHIYDWE